MSFLFLTEAISCIFLKNDGVFLVFTIPGVPEKEQNGGFLVHCELKVLHMFISLDRASSAEENDT